MEVYIFGANIFFWVEICLLTVIAVCELFFAKDPEKCIGLTYTNAWVQRMCRFFLVAAVCIFVFCRIEAWVSLPLPAFCVSMVFLGITFLIYPFAIMVVACLVCVVFNYLVSLLKWIWNK